MMFNLWNYIFAWWAAGLIWLKPQDLFQVQFPQNHVCRVGSEVKADDLSKTCDLFQKKNSNIGVMAHDGSDCTHEFPCSG